MSDFRERLLDALNDSYEKYDGDTPDHIIVSESVYADLSAENVDHFPLSGEGYLGMTLWHSAALDERGKDALLLSDEVFAECLLSETFKELQ